MRQYNPKQKSGNRYLETSEWEETLRLKLEYRKKMRGKGTDLKDIYKRLLSLELNEVRVQNRVSAIFGSLESLSYK